jgi:hypothetical protein
VFNRYNGKYELRLQQYYADVSWWYFKLHAGARRETFGNQYNPLSSGSLLYSGNARLIPKVAVSSDYMPVLIYGTRMTRIIQMITDYKYLSWVVWVVETPCMASLRPKPFPEECVVKGKRRPCPFMSIKDFISLHLQV